MRYRKLGNTGYEVSEVGMGTWAIGGVSWRGKRPSGWEGADDEESLKALRKARELGVNFFDTADAYGRGKSEVLISLALGKHRDQCIIATKVGNNLIDTRGQDFSREYIIGALNASLVRLGSEYVDVYQLHNPPLEIIKKGEVFDVLRELKESGKIKAFGVSIGKPEEGIEAIKHGVETIQVVYNLLYQEPAKELFPLAMEKKVGIIARVPLASGLLTGKYNENTVFPKSDHRSVSYPPERLKKEIKKVRKLEFLLEEEEVESMAQAALKFVLSHKAVSTVIPGAKNERQIMENVKASDGKPLSPQALQKIQDLYQNNFYLD